MIFPKINVRLGRPPKDIIRIGKYWITESNIKSYRDRFTKDYVYVIKCSMTGHVVYVGRTYQPYYRKQSHFCDSSKSLVGRWYRAMKSIGHPPIFEVIDTTYGRADYMECQYIMWYASFGQANFNIKHNFFYRKQAS